MTNILFNNIYDTFLEGIFEIPGRISAFCINIQEVVIQLISTVLIVLIYLLHKKLSVLFNG